MSKYIITACHNMTGDGITAFFGSLSSLAEKMEDVSIICLGDLAMGTKEFSCKVDVQRLPLYEKSNSIVVDRFRTAVDLALADDDVVLFVDSRDLVFQDNPFDDMLVQMRNHNVGLVATAESQKHTLDSEKSNRIWQENLNGGVFPAHMNGRAILYCGCWGGMWKHVNEHLVRMLDMMSGHAHWFGLDQAVHNRLVWETRQDWRILHQENTLCHHLCLVEKPTYRKHVVYNAIGTLPCVVHQYDRHPELANNIITHYGKTYELLQ